ncbi:hypothetical protein E1B28_009422 [Marasmius oreades]|uniref:Uncharacterized protein n=1 Tax=Marasmius oreades TaxID=181124 RepID=A0A9P7UVB1_9AGAR|nr:uncharacterized protein E1B28_009422 [Marasmius oreades]KAG7093139.1 hypothetical protein E1B28_009422 [Marasmius oreades]
METITTRQKENEVAQTVQCYNALDGKFGTLLENNDYFVTSPNSETMYMPNLGPCRITQRKDFYYGADDHLLYPQPFIPFRCHWASIPRRPLYDSDPLAKWWKSLPDNAFIMENGAVEGLGKWDKKHVARYRKDVDAIRARAFSYKMARRSTGKEVNELVSVLNEQLYRTLHYLTSMVFPLLRAQQLWATFRRWYLELLGALDWVEIMKPIMDGQELPTSSSRKVASKAMGAFVHHVRDCENLFVASIPLWYIRPRSELANVQIRDKPTDIHSPATIKICTEPFSNRIIYQGRADDTQKALAIEKHCLEVIDCGNPFDSVLVVHNTMSSSSDSPPTSHFRIVKKSKNTKKKRESNRVAPYTLSKPTSCPQPQRDKFAEIRNEVSLPVADVWVKALNEIDRTLRPPKDSGKNSGYAFPDPNMILFAPKEKRFRMLKSWTRFRAVLIFRHMMPASFTSGAWTSEQWRILLALSETYTSSTSNDGFMAKQRQSVYHLLSECFKFHKLKLNLDNVNTHVFSWRNREVPVRYLNDDEVVKEIVWELFELNFRIEFQALHRRLCVTERQPSRNSIGAKSFEGIYSCFYDSKNVNNPTQVDFDGASKGLAAINLEDRNPYMLPFCRVLVQWPGGDIGTELLKNCTVESDLMQSQLAKLENWAVPFYCQSFYSMYGRPPIIPHCLDKLTTLPEEVYSDYGDPVSD